MSTVTSKDGTNIVYDKQGEGPAVIVILGSMCSRLTTGAPELAKLLAENFTVYNYDRRNRGDSGDTKPYAVEREIEDIEALLAEAGGSAYLYGNSAGACLAMEAAVKLGAERVTKLAMYEAPYNDDEKAQDDWMAYGQELNKLVDAGNTSDATALFMKLVGAPADQIEGMRHAPFWASMEALAPSLTYDYTLIGGRGTVPTDRAAQVSVPTLLMNGSNGYPPMHTTAVTLSEVMPQSKLQVLEGQDHRVDEKVLVPVLVDFFNA